jgi:hypothetical protein
MKAKTQSPEVAFYYPNPFWYDSDWIKNLILFFDGVALLVPEYMKDRIEQLDPAMVTGLSDHNLLHIIEPEKAVDKAATEKLATVLTDIIVSDRLNDLAKDKTDFQHLSRSRLGYYGDEGLAKMIFDELKKRGLASESEDNVTIKLHPIVRSLILTLLSQITRPYGKKINLELNPVTDRQLLVGALNDLLSLPNTPSSGNIVTFDLNVVSVDLGPIPIDEVLSFRSENLNDFRKYQKQCKAFAFELSRMNEEERKLKFDLRQEHLNDLANDLRKRSRNAWRKPASFALTMSGAAWTLATGDIVGGAIATAGGLLGIEKSRSEVGAYSYLFKAHDKWS